jgi:hypothetical protein
MTAPVLLPLLLLLLEAFAPQARVLRLPQGPAVQELSPFGPTGLARRRQRLLAPPRPPASGLKEPFQAASEFFFQPVRQRRPVA